jgi:hypothetical protein
VQEVGCRFPSSNIASGGGNVNGNGSSAFTVSGLTGTQTPSSVQGLDMAQAPASVFEMDIFVQTTGYFTLTTPSGSHLTTLSPKP